MKVRGVLLLLVVLFTHIACAQPEYVNVLRHGVTGDGKADVSSIINKLLETNAKLFFPKGKYLLESPLNVVKSNTILKGEEGTVFIGSYSFPDENMGIINIKEKSGIRIEQIKYEDISKEERAKFFIYCKSSSNIEVANVQTENSGIIVLTADAYYKDVVAPTSKNIIIQNCSANGGNMMNKAVGMFITYTSGWKVKDCVVKNCYQGVQWWGGDSNPAVDGALQNARKCSDGTIENVTVSNIIGGGIWGSMGQNITVGKSNVSKCKDVGIDFEGCFDSKAIENIVSDCDNGGLAVFHYNRNITFKSNVISSSNNKFITARIYNSSQDINSKNITFSNNTFSTINGIGYFDQQGAADSVYILNNQFNNTALALASNNNRLMIIQGNKFMAKQVVKDPILTLGNNNNNGKLYIQDNVIMLTKTASNEYYPIHIHQGDFNSSPETYVKGNRIQGSDRDVLIVYSGANGGTSNKVYFDKKQKALKSKVKVIDKGSAKTRLFFDSRI